MIEILVNLPEIEREYEYDIEIRGIPLYVRARNIKVKSSWGYLSIEGNLALFRKRVERVRVWKPRQNLLGRVEEGREKWERVFDLSGVLEKTRIASYSPRQQTGNNLIEISADDADGTKKFFRNLNDDLINKYHKRMRFEDFSAVFSQMYNHYVEWMQRTGAETQDER